VRACVRARAHARMDDQTRVPICLLAFTVVQLALPLRYYLCPAHDPTDEQHAWRMFSEQMWSRHDLRLYWWPRATQGRTSGGGGDDGSMIHVFVAVGARQRRVCAPHQYVRLGDHFTRRWSFRLEHGPQSTLVRACEYLCERIPAAARVRYEWTLDEWRHRGQPQQKRTWRGGATCPRANSTRPL